MKEIYFMKRQVRRGVFETNSSSVHILTMCIKSDFDRWSDGETFLYDDNGYGYPSDNKPVYENFYTKEECIAFIKSSRYTPDDDFDWNNEESVEELLEECDFRSYKGYERDYEWFEDSYITPSGEEIVAFGYYGSDR